MMEIPFLDTDRLTAYARMLACVTGGDPVLKIVLRDENMELPRELPGKNQVSQWQALAPGLESRSDENNNVQIRCGIELGSEQTPAWLIMNLNNCQAGNLPFGNGALNAIYLIKKLIMEDFKQRQTLDGMAHELAIRYEELNAIYGLESITQCFTDDNFDEHKALRMLCDSCLDYLRVDLINIIVPSEKLAITHIVDDASIRKLDKLQRYLQHELFRKFQDSNQTWVINRHEVTDWVGHDFEIPYKMIISPITSTDNRVIGMFVLVNNPTRPDFTNSDRKLGDVLATETSNILIRKLDNLTGLLNRHGFESRLINAIENRKNTGQDYCLININVDQFRIINNTVGFSGGDKLLREIAQILQDETPAKSVIARTGADEFSILLECKTNHATVLSENIMRTLSERPHIHKKSLFNVNLSIGILNLQDDMLVPRNVLTALEITCKSAKSLGGNRIRVYDPRDSDLIDERTMLSDANMIRKAIHKNNFILFAQEIVPLNHSSEDGLHYEILVRMIDGKNIISPGRFIPAAERYKVMTDLDRWIIGNAFEQLAAWNPGNIGTRIILSINISGQSINDDRFSSYVENILKSCPVNPDQICFEITETEAVRNMAQAIKFISRMREIGFSFALDDFGSGMSSFYYLKNMPVEYLKIDGAFVRNILTDAMDYSMVESMNNIGHVIGLKTIAEFAESREICEALAGIGVDYLQGYHIHKPQRLSEILCPENSASRLKVAGN